MVEAQFRYVAVDPAGKRQRGRIPAASDAAAYAALRRDGLSPLSLHLDRRTAAAPAIGGALRPTDAAEFLGSLAELLTAGADVRTALGILGDRFDRAGVKRLAEQLAADIGGGDPLEAAFGRGFGRRQPFVAPMVAAGEAAGDLPGGLRRAGEVIASRLRLRDQLVSVLAYPTFVLISALAAVLAILIFIVPSIAPLAEALGVAPAPAMVVMSAASDFLRGNAGTLAVGLAGLAGMLVLAGRAGALSAPLERLLLDGPLRRTAGGLVFGSFALSLGAMVQAGAPIGDALRLAIRAAPYEGARRRLEPVAGAVRQGEYLSDALARVRGFPSSIVRLAAVGEASNTVGALLIRSGRMEEEAALRRIEAAGRIAGPALIVALGGLLGLLMAGLLSGVSQMGQAGLQ